MKITERTDSRLTLNEEQVPTWGSWLPLAAALTGGGLYLLLSRINAPSGEPLAAILSFLSVLSAFVTGMALLFLVVFLVICAQHPVETCTFDKRRGVVTIVTRELWRLRARHVESIPLCNITAVTLEQVPDEHRIVARLATRSSSIALGSEPVIPQTVMAGMIGRIRSIDELDTRAMPPKMPGVSIIEVSKEVSAFLQVPLQFLIGHQTVLPGLGRFGQPRVKPIYCAGCGGPLPPSRTGVEQQTCPYCGATMRVEWQPGHEH